VGILYSTREQAEAIRDSLLQAGLDNIDVMDEPYDAKLETVDVIVVPSEMPGLRDRVNGDVEVIEFGNVLDEASLRMVREVVDDLRDRKATGVSVGVSS
jgi:hypothetical protein